MFAHVYRMFGAGRVNPMLCKPDCFPSDLKEAALRAGCALGLGRSLGLVLLFLLALALA